MPRSSSLRFRVALAFAVFGALLSILLSTGLYLTAHELGHRLMDETLRAELEDSVERHARDSIFVPPNTVSIKGFILAGTEPGHFAPPVEIGKLPPGNYSISIGEIDYRVLIADRNGFRYFMMFDTNSQHEREAKFFRFLFYFALLMTAVSAGGGFWLAARIITPVSRLAEEVGKAEPGDTNLSLKKMARNDEVGELARAFDRYLRRMEEFIERENYFTADVSHELRTPISIVLGTVELLETDETLSIKQRERIERIRRASKDMSDLSVALLMLARERLPTSDEESCNVGDVVRACVEKHRHLIGDRPINLEVEVVGDLHLNVERPLLEIVIGNLLRNALFNTQAGSISLILDAERLVLKDTGFGMTEEVLARVFERHFKGASSAGAGVGLSLVRRICDRYGWAISLDSQEGQGTTAELRFLQSTRVTPRS